MFLFDVGLLAKPAPVQSDVKTADLSQFNIKQNTCYFAKNDTNAWIPKRVLSERQNHICVLAGMAREAA